MEVIFIILPIALVMAGAAAMAFLYAAKRGQFDDLDTPQVRVLFEDDRPAIPGERRTH